MTVRSFSKVMTWQHVAAGITMLALSVAAVWSRVPPISEIVSEGSAHVPPGGRLVIDREVRWNRWDCSDISISASLTDSLGYAHALEEKHVGEPHYVSKTSRGWPIPYTMPLGTATYRAKIKFSCFPFYSAWPIIITLQEIVFGIEP